MVEISLSLRTKKNEVIKFLEELRTFLCREDFCIDNDFVLIRKKKPDDVEHSTPYTVLDLDYDNEDIVARIKELTVEEYSETIIDQKNMDPPFLYVFGKKINKKLVYIKIKIKDNGKKHILCVSFHYPAAQMIFPYAQK